VASIARYGQALNFCRRRYDDLISAFRERVEGLNISRRELDNLAGLAVGHSGKLLQQAKPRDSRQVRYKTED